MDYEAVIGLEVHVQLNTKTKAFCGCSTEFGAPPNTQVCPVCMGQPGVLPAMNEKALHKSIQAGLTLNSEIAGYSKFDRKNYFYPDLPKGYQISQFDYPIAKGGFLEFDLPDGSVKKVGITRAHMEEDAGKLIHAEGTSYSYVDLNRSGVPLLEIVSEPDMRGSEEAFYYLKELRNIMKYTGVSDVNMEEGSLRCDANVSIRPKGQKELGTKVEIKNMNSFNGVRKAIDYEIERQISALGNGEKIRQETRLFDSAQNKTFSMRSKEEANDYRYFPEPDLPPVVVDKETVEKIKLTLPELPRAKKIRFMREYGIPLQDAEALTDDKDLADYFEETKRNYNGEAKKAANWILSEANAYINVKKVSALDFRKIVTPSSTGELLNFIEEGTISGKIAKDVFAEMVESKKNAKEIIEKKGLKQISDTGELETLVNQVLTNNPGEIEKYKAGKLNLMGFFVGEVMKLTKGQANPKVVNELLRKKLEQEIL
jgi:aspartyl-tRNA(Asn)/glutamyl-tRNA(Gln) amidotransferase subunit B